jgi:hypothetical protein
MIDMLCAIRCLMTGLEKFKDWKIQGYPTESRS